MNGLLLLAASEIPDLRPMREELPPTFWEQHGWQMCGVAAILVGAIIMFAWWSRRPRSIVIVAPADVARRQLERLRDRADDSEVVAEVSQIVRRFTRAILGLENNELTTEDLIRVFSADPKLRPETRQALADFLRECDLQKFAPNHASMKPGVVQRALDLIAKVESDCQPLTAVATPASPPSAA